MASSWTRRSRISETLRPLADNPRFVQTLPRRGYRFIGPVDKPSSLAPSPTARKGRFERLTAKARWISVGATLLALLSGIGVWRFSRNRVYPVLLPIEVAPLAGLPGVQIEPAFSPDGNQVAFVLRGTEKNCGIYTTMVGGEKSLRLTSDCDDTSPTWSPDGRRVAFYRYDNGMAIYVVPAFGGSEHRLYKGPFSPSARGLDWSPDGNVLAFSGGRRIGKALGFRYFRSSIPRHESSRHPQARRSIIPPPSRPTVRLLLSSEELLGVRWRTSM